MYEDDTTLAFLDIFPFVKGHTLVIPKKHFRWVWDMQSEDYHHLMVSVKKVAGLLKKSFQTDYVQILVMGQQISHAHVHLLPRTKEDGLPEMVNSPIATLSKEEMLSIQNRIRNSS